MTFPKFLYCESGGLVKRVFMGLGVIMLFVGVIMFSVSNFPPVEKEDVVLIEELLETFDISGNFDKGEKLLVFFHAPNWGGPYPIPDPDSAIVDVDVLDPFDNKTEFRIQFNRRANPELWLRSNDTGGLDITQPLEGIVGVTKYAGEYKAHIKELAAIYYNSAPPPVLRLYKVLVDMVYPYRNYLPVGVGLVVVGVAVTVWGARASESVKKTVGKRS